jgi:hypothetical protein
VLLNTYCTLCIALVNLLLLGLVGFLFFTFLKMCSASGGLCYRLSDMLLHPVYLPPLPKEPKEIALWVAARTHHSFFTDFDPQKDTLLRLWDNAGIRYCDKYQVIRDYVALSEAAQLALECETTESLR